MKKTLSLLVAVIAFAAAFSQGITAVPVTYRSNNLPSANHSLWYISNRWQPQSTAQVKSILGYFTSSDTANLFQAYRNAINGRQATLVSGSNIKTVNSKPLPGSGNIAIHPFDITDYQAVGDWNGTTGTDNDTYIQAAITAAISASANTVFLPLGAGQRYYTASKINITSGNFTLRGDAPVQNMSTGAKGYITGANGIGAIIDYGNDQNLTTGAFYVDGLAFYKPSQGGITSAMKVSMNNNGPHRGITLRNVSAKGFTNVLELNCPTGSNVVGASVDIEGCNFTEVTNAVNSVEETFGLRFVGNQSEAGGSIVGKFSGPVEIAHNMLESNTNAVNIESNSFDFKFHSNYMEACDGDYVVRLKSGNAHSTAEFGENYVLQSSTATDWYLIEGPMRLNVEQRKFFVNGVPRRSRFTLKNGYLLPGSSLMGEGFYIQPNTTATAYFKPSDYPQTAPAGATSVVKNDLGSVHLNTPFGLTTTGMSVNGYSSGNDKSMTLTYSTSDYVVFTALLNITNAADEKPYVYLLNQANADVKSAGEVRFSKSHDGDWQLMTVVFKPDAAGTALKVRWGTDEDAAGPTSSTMNVAAIGAYVVPAAQRDTFYSAERIYAKPFVPFRINAKKPSDITTWRRMGSAIGAQTMRCKLYEIGTGGATQSDGISAYSLLEDLPEDIIATSITFYQVVQGSFTSDNTNELSIFELDASGTLVELGGTGDVPNLWKGAANSFQTNNLTSPITLLRGHTYYVANLYNSSVQTTAPTIGAAATGPANAAASDFSNSVKESAFANSVTGLPSSVAMSSLSGSGGRYWFRVNN